MKQETSSPVDEAMPLRIGAGISGDFEESEGLLA